MHEWHEKDCNIDKLYSHHQYVNPTCGEWHTWFAWRPVKMCYWKKSSEEFYLKCAKTVWLKKIIRRKVVDFYWLNHINNVPLIKSDNIFYEYTTLEDIIRWA